MIRDPRIKGFGALLSLLVVVLAIVHWNWIFSLAPLQSADWPYFYAAQLKEWFPFHFFWITYDGLGRSISQGNFIYLFSLYGLLAQLGANFEVVSRLLFFLPVLICAPYGSYLAVRYITGNNVAGLIGAFVYSLNTYFIVIQAGHMHICVAYALAPFAYYFAAKDARRSYIWMFTILAIISVYDVRMALIIGLFAAMIALFHKVKRKTDFVVFLRNMLLGGAALVLFSAFWILPMHYTDSGPFTRNVFDQQALNWISSLDSFSIHHPFWSSEGVTDFVFESAPFYMFALPLLAFLPFALRRRSWDSTNKILLFYGFVGIVSLVMLMQENSLLAGVYKLVYDNLPLMSMFRESSKMFFITSFCYSVLIGYLLIELHKRNEKRWANALVALLLIVILLPITPYLSGQYVKAFKKEPIQEDIAKINKVVTKPGQTPTRTLWVSRTPEFARFSYATPSIDASDFGGKYWNRYVSPFSGHGITFLNEPFAPALLNFAGISYVAVPRDDIDSNYHHYDDRDAGYYQQQVSKWGLKKIETINGTAIWETANPKPYMYFSENNIKVDTLANYSGIDDSLKSTYLFADQNVRNASLIDRMSTNREVNIYQPRYLNVTNQKLTSSFKVPPGDVWKLHARSTDKPTTFQATELGPMENLAFDDSRITGKNLYSNGSFEATDKIVIGDCNNADKTPLERNGISGAIVNAGHPGGKSLRIKAGKHIACYFNKISEFDKRAHYHITLDYKYISGPAPYIALHPFSEEPEKRQATLKTDNPNNWSTYTTIVRPGQFTDELSLNIYVPTKVGTTSEVIIDNVQVHKLPYAPSGYLKSQNPSVASASFDTLATNPVRHQLKLDRLTRPQLFVFSESFDPNWRLSVKRSDAAARSSAYIVTQDKHVIANGFANAWYIDPASFPSDMKNDDGSYILELEYMPQRWFYVGASISGLVVLVMVIFVVIDVIRQRRQTLQHIRTLPRRD